MLHSYNNIRQLYCYIKKKKMNIYTILMSKDKCQTFFPKLGATIKKQFRDSSQHVVKKMSTQKLRNKSIDNTGKFRATYHDILQFPLSTNLSKHNQKQQQSTIMKKTFVKKPLQSLSKINEYTIVKEIGKGGFAEVVEVKDDQGNGFAIKQYLLQNSFNCFNNQYIVGEHFFEKGKLRSKFAQKRGGNNLINFVKKFKNNRKGYIVQEIGGKSLSKTISQIHGVFHKGQRVYQVQFSKFYEQLAVKKRLKDVIIQIAQGIRLLNSQGFIHCDLKPQNILINESQNNTTCKIIDFGSAFQYENGLPKITITPEYMPPQLLQAIQSDNTQAVLSKIDVWSIGCIMLQIMTGIPLWFRYKCKVRVNGRQSLQLSCFALTNRQYRKIIKKQKEVCQSIKKISFTYPQFQVYRKILLKVLVFEQSQRATIDELIAMLQKIQ